MAAVSACTSLEESTSALLQQQLPFVTQPDPSPSCPPILPARMALADIRSFGQRGKAPGQFEYPVAVVIADGLLYVTERTGKRLQVLTRMGEVVDELAAPCGGWLYGCCVDSTGKVWVSSSSTHRVHLITPNLPLTRDPEPDIL